MTPAYLTDAQANLSRLVESGAEAEIVVGREGKPAARFLAVATPNTAGRRLGLLEGQFSSLSQKEFGADNVQIAYGFAPA
jgi:hypothetical protein